MKLDGLLVQPSARSIDIRPFKVRWRTDAIKCSLGRDTVPCVSDPGTHACIEERLHSRIDFAVVQLLEHLFEPSFHHLPPGPSRDIASSMFATKSLLTRW